MGVNTELKAKLFDLLDEKKTLQNQQATLLKANEEKEELIEEIRGELNAVLSVAEKRGEMIRELVRENRELRVKLQTPAITEEDVAEARNAAIREAMEQLERMIEPAIAKGFNF